MEQNNLAKARKIVERLFKLPVNQRKPALEKLRKKYPELHSSVDLLLSARKSGELADEAAEPEADDEGAHGNYPPIAGGNAPSVNLFRTMTGAILPCINDTLGIERTACGN
ncbi:MAG TPA: hypothetical protein VGG19_16995 [Tepidisphaeraceae bacterium]|jgi:hypothetical protein